MSVKSVSRQVCFFVVVLLIGLSDVQAVDLGVPKTDEGLAGEGPIHRYGWFTKLWLKRRTAWAKELQQDQGAIVLLGDSITEDWRDIPKGAFPGVKTANRGISGDTTRGVLYRLKEDVLDVNPSCVVLLIGTNDLEVNATPEVIAGNLALIIAELKKHNPKMPIILCNVFPSSASKKRAAEPIQKINQLYFAAVKGDPQVTVLDTWRLFANEQGDAKKDEFPDLLHPNKKGYAKWAAALRPLFATLGFMDTEADDFQMEDGYTSLFNGEDLTGWGFREGKAKKGEPRKKERKEIENFNGKVASDDGRYVAINGRLVVTTPPEGRRIQQLWTSTVFPQNFVLKLEFRATPNADSGVFIRRPQLQCRDYLLAGPWKALPNYKPQDWNEIVVTVKDNIATSTCNGDALGEPMKLPATGPIGLEGDRGQIEYRRIRLKTME